MKLSIVIPALNEEESIASIIERSLAAEDTLKNKSGITSIEVIVVSDGSTDKTVEIASTYIPKIKLIIFSTFIICCTITCIHIGCMSLKNYELLITLNINIFLYFFLFQYFHTNTSTIFFDFYNKIN